MALVAMVSIAAVAAATQVPRRSLEDLVADSDHVLLAEIVRVTMVDADGRQLESPKAATGPGRDNELRLHIEVQEVLATNAAEVPDVLVIPLWKMWHYSLDQWQKYEGTTRVFLLEGPEFKLVYPAGFMRSSEEKSEIKALLEAASSEKVDQ